MSMKVGNVTVVVALAPLAILGALTFLSADSRDGGRFGPRLDLGRVPAYPLTSAGRAHFER